MDHAITLSWESILQGLGLFAIAALPLGAISSYGRDVVGGLWMLAWASFLLTAGFFLAADAGYPLGGHLALIGDSLFAPLMLMGAIELYPKRSAPLWPLALGLFAGFLRIGLDSLEFDAATAVLCGSVTPALFGAAAWATYRAPETIHYRRMIAGLFGAMVFVELADAYSDFAAHENAIPWRLLIAVCVPLATLQIASRLMTLWQAAEIAESNSDAAVQELDLERWRFEAVFDRVGEIVAELSPDGRLLFGNGRLRELLGVDSEDLIGTSAFVYIAAEFREAAAEEFGLILKRGGTKDPIIVPLIDRHGEERFVECTLSDYAFPGEQRILFLGRDVSDRERADRKRALELQASLNRVQEQDRLATVGTLASGLAHQINNPIGGILAAAQFALLAEGAPDGSQISRDAFERIVDEARRAGRIVRSSLGFARDGEVMRWVEDLTPLVVRTTELVRIYVADRGGQIEIETSGAALPVVMSPIELEQVIVNLLRNAAESREGGARIQVRLGTEGVHALLEIQDDGRGIPTSDHARVFEPFYTTRLAHGGSGLGLSVVRDIIQAHGGTIAFQSPIGGGTCVCVRIPLAVTDG